MSVDFGIYAVDWKSFAARVAGECGECVKRAAREDKGLVVFVFG